MVYIRKVFLLMMVFIMMFCCASCNTKEEKDPFLIEDNVSDSDEDIVIDFDDVLKNINENKVFPNTSLDSGEYTHSFYDTLELVSMEEAMATTKDHVRKYDKNNVLKDMDLYLRLLKSYYGAYEYFGGDEAFEPAFEKIVKEIEEYESDLNQDVITDIVIRNLDFVIDGHAKINEVEFLEYNNLSYKDYYLKDLYFYEDDEGYYTKINDRKWYIKSVINDNDILSYLRLSIDDDGRLAYIVLLSACDDDERLNDPYLVLTRISRESEYTFNWTAFSQREENRHDYYQKLENIGGIPVVTVRDFMESDLIAKQVPERLGIIGERTKDADVIVYDVLTSYDYDELIKPKGYEMFWLIQNFKVSNVARYIGRNGIMPQETVSGEYFHRSFDAVPVEDKTVKFFIQDRDNGSGGENMLSAFDTLYNTVFVGGRSKGQQICGGVYGFCLPNSGILVYFGMNLMFNRNTLDNFDGKGYEPDIWVDPLAAEEKILKLCDYYSLNNSVGFEEYTGAE